MKVLLSVMVFALALTLGSKSIAETTGVSDTSHNKAQDNTQNVPHVDGHDSQQLFPQPQPIRENAYPPAKVELLEPATWSQVSGQTTLKWKEVAGAADYHVQVATDPNFKWLVADEHLYKGTSYEVKNLEPGKHYYWRVAAHSSEKWAGSTKGLFTKSMFSTK